MEKSLKEKKEELKKAWEECFEMKIEDKLNDKGLEHFWSDDTSEKEAAEILTAGAIDMLLDDMLDDLLGIVIIKGNPNKNEKSGKKYKKSGKKYRVVGDGFTSDKTFTTIEGAENYRDEMAKASHFTVDDLEIVEVVK